VLALSDQLSATTTAGDDGLEVPSKLDAPLNIGGWVRWPAFCTGSALLCALLLCQLGSMAQVRGNRLAAAGILYLRHSTATVQFVERWLASLTEPSIFDHMAFNDLVKQGWVKSNPRLHPANSRLFLGLGGNLTVGVLPVASFGNGHTFFIQQLHRVGAAPGLRQCSYGCAGAANAVGLPTATSAAVLLGAWSESPPLAPLRFSLRRYTMWCRGLCTRRTSLAATWAGATG
jgi:hypothetical protein